MGVDDYKLELSPIFIEELPLAVQTLLFALPVDGSAIVQV